MTLDIVEHFPECVKVNLGGGYKVVCFDENLDHDHYYNLYYYYYYS